MLCIIAFTMFNFPQFIDQYSHSQGKIVAKTDEIVTVPLQPRKEIIMELPHYYLLPKSTFSKPKGVLVVLHACQRSGLEFFHLPEDRIVAQDALQKGLAVLALTSQDRQSGCFTQQDVSWVGKVVDEWSKLHSLQDIPRFGLALSSGASFLFFVYKELRLETMAVYNTPQTFLPSDMENKRAIPTAFVNMPVDKPMAKQIRKNYDGLMRQGVPTQLFRVSPRPFTKTICDTKFPEILAHDCDKIFDVLEKDFSHLLDKDGFVKDKSSSAQWRQFFDSLGLDSRTNDLYFLTPKAFSGHSWTWATVEQEVRSCHAHHDMTSEHHSSILDFLMTASPSSSEATEKGT